MIIRFFRDYRFRTAKNQGLAALLFGNVSQIAEALFEKIKPQIPGPMKFLFSSQIKKSLISGDLTPEIKKGLSLFSIGGKNVSEADLVRVESGVV